MFSQTKPHKTQPRRPWVSASLVVLMLAGLLCEVVAAQPPSPSQQQSSPSPQASSPSPQPSSSPQPATPQPASQTQGIIDYDYILIHVPLLLFFGIAAYWMYRLTRRSYSRSFTIAHITLGGRKVLLPISLLVLIAIISIELGALIKALTSVGMVFPIFTGLITITGFLFTLSKLDDIFSRILSYDVLVDRCADMIAKEIQDVRDGGKAGRIFIVANAVTFGNISAHETYNTLLKRLFDAFHDQYITVKIITRDWEWIIPDGMNEEDKKVPLRPEGNELEEGAVARITDTSLGKFYWSWNGRGRWNDDTLKKPYYQSVALLHTLRKSQVNSEYGVSKQAYAFKDRHAPLHAVVTSTRALLFHVVEIPLEGKQQEKERVHVIGSETSDPAIIQRIEEAFNYHAEQCELKVNKCIG